MKLIVLIANGKKHVDGASGLLIVCVCESSSDVSP